MPNKVSASSRRGGISLDIPFNRTSPVTALGTGNDHRSKRINRSTTPTMMQSHATLSARQIERSCPPHFRRLGDALSQNSDRCPLLQNSDTSRNLLDRFFFSLYALFWPSSITHFTTSSPKQHGLMKYSFGSAMLKAVLSNVTTVLISEVMVPKMILTLRKNQVRNKSKSQTMGGMQHAGRKCGSSIANIRTRWLAPDFRHSGNETARPDPIRGEGTQPDRRA
jgi:hypothetical protein